MALGCQTALRGPDLFCPDFYGKQTCRNFATKADAWRHYLSDGIASGYEPAPHFHSKWYVWQNPDSKAHPSVLDHFAKAGQTRMIDPSPFLDLTQLSRQTHARTSGEAYLSALNGRWTSKDGFFHGYSDLEANQSAYLDRLQPELIFDNRSQNRAPCRKRLVWVQIGPGAEFPKWFDRTLPRSWDVLCNWYDFDAVDLSMGEVALAQQGTKFTGVAKALEHHRHLFEAYDQVLFLDDDLIFDFASIDRLFDIAAQKNYALFQAALTAESFCVWPALKAASDLVSKEFNTVEIMMPGFATDFLLSAAPLFRKSVSGFGLDMALGQTARQQGRKAGVIFDVRARHLRPINPATGPYYENMRKNGINPKLELWKLIQEYQADLDIKALHE